MGSVDITASQQTLRGVLRSSIYQVSVFQRPYAWEKKQQEELLLDFMQSIGKDAQKNYKEGDFFLGNFIFHKKDKYGPVYIVDGQQRLITSTIILVVIRDILFTIHQNSHIRKQLRDQSSSLIEEIEAYIYLREDQKLKPIITPVGNSEKEYFFSEILNLEPETIQERKTCQKEALKNYSIGYNLLKDIIDDKLEKEKNFEQRIKYLRILYRQIILSELIVTTISDEERAYKIYSNINSKGLYLGQVDLIKNDFYYKTKNYMKIPGVDRQTKLWDSIYNNVLKNSTVPFEKFYELCWYISYPEDISEYYESSISLFEIFQKKFPSETSAKKILHFFNELETLSKLIVDFKMPDSVQKWKKNDWPKYTKKLIFMKKIGSDSITNRYAILLLPLWHKYLKENNKKYEKALKMMIEFLSDTLLIYQLLNRYSDTEIEVLKKIEDLLSTAFQKVVCYDGNVSFRPVLDELIDERKVLLQPHQDLIVSLISKLKYSKKIDVDDVEYIRYILQRMNEKKELKCELVIGSIEHIIEDETRSDESKSIGNLIWLETIYNEKCSTLKHSVKIDGIELLKKKFEIYKDSEYPEVKKLLREYLPIDFKSSSIKQRAETIAETFIKEYVFCEL